MSFAMRLMTPLLVLLPLTAMAADVDRYLPNDTKDIICINVQQIRESDWYKKHNLLGVDTQALKDKFGPINKLMTVAGIDPGRDIKTVTLVSTSEKGMEPNTFIVHASANLALLQTGMDLQAKTKPAQWASGRQDNLAFYEYGNREEKKENSILYIAFLDRDTVFASYSKDMLAEAIAKATNKKKTTIDKNLQTLVTRINAKQHAWAATLPTGELKKTLEDRPQLKDLRDTIQGITGGVTFHNGAAAEFRVQSTSTKAAETAQKAAEALLGDLAEQIEKNEYKELKFPDGFQRYLEWVDASRQLNPRLMKEMLKAAKTTNEKGTIIINSKVSDAKFRETLRR